MGCVFSAASLACCFGSAACSLCCSCCPSCNNSTSTRIVYSLFLLLTTVISCIMLSPGIEEKLEKIKWLCDNTIHPVDCTAVVGYLAVYRVQFAVAMFFLLFAIIMIGVKSSRDPRGGIQNGFWFFKFLILVGAIVGAFFIPKDSSFVDAWMYIGLVGSFLFILVQLVLLVDFAHSWNETWVDNMEESNSKCWMFMLLFFTFIMYAVSIAGIVCMFVYFTQSDTEKCGLEKFVVSFQLILGIVISGIAIHPKVQERQPKSGLLQAAAITLYTTYLTWSALLYTSTTCNKVRGVTGDNLKPTFDSESIIGIVVTFILVIFACVRTSSSSQIGKLGLSDKGGDATEATTLGQPGDQNEDAENRGQVVSDDETEQITYSYTFFHVTMIFASLYIMMTVTNWYKPHNDLTKLSSSAAAFWIKISSSWVCMALYMWTLLAPIIFPDRDFD